MNIVPLRPTVNKDVKYNAKPLSYQMSDIHSVFTHWDPKLCKNVETPNRIDNDGGFTDNGE